MSDEPWKFFAYTVDLPIDSIYPIINWISGLTKCMGTSLAPVTATKWHTLLVNFLQLIDPYSPSHFLLTSKWAKKVAQICSHLV